MSPARLPADALPARDATDKLVGHDATKESQFGTVISSASPEFLSSSNLASVVSADDIAAVLSRVERLPPSHCPA